MPILDSLHTYPVKSCAGLSHERIAVGARGLAGDRRYMLVNDHGRFLTGRQFPDLVLVRVHADEESLQLAAPGMPDLTIAGGGAQDPLAVQIWRDDTTAHPVAPAADAWFSQYLGMACRLVQQRDSDVRAARDIDGNPTRDPVSFADGYPQLLIGTASLADLNTRLATPVAMGRFRPNLVVDTDRPYVEDGWRRLRIGDCEFDVVKRCARCVFTTIDPLSGRRDPQGEPLATLRRYRLDRTAPGVMFGVNLLPRRLGELAPGMPVKVLA